MCTPAFYVKSTVAKIGIYAIYFLCILMFGLGIFEYVFATSKYTWTDSFLTPTMVPFYAGLSVGQQASTARYSFYYWFLMFNHLKPLAFIIPLILLIIGLKEAAAYGFMSIIILINVAFCVIQNIILILAYFDPPGFWFVHLRDITVIGYTNIISMEFHAIFWIAMVYPPIGVGCVIIIQILQGTMRVVVKQEGDIGVIPIGSSINNKRYKH
jgi:hypothetical protein